jgi:ferritin-like metal-binding protein YciE
MGRFSKDIKTMDLLLHDLQDIYYAEQQITKALLIRKRLIAILRPG